MLPYGVARAASCTTSLSSVSPGIALRRRVFSVSSSFGRLTLSGPQPAVHLPPPTIGDLAHAKLTNDISDILAL